MVDIEKEIKSGDRFEFGKNWKKFLDTLNEERISEAKNSLKKMLSLDSFAGKSFLDIGCGSGLFSLAAKRLGADVVSVDYDPEAVGCAMELKNKYYKDSKGWRIERGSALDKEYIESLGEYDIVYSWGVLHHTGAMDDALRNAAIPVKNGGLLFVSIYNKQPIFSPFWLRVKKLYNRLPGPGRFAIALLYYFYFVVGAFALDMARGKNPIDRHRGVSRRGMSMYRDAVDWVGGLPFEVASPEEVFSLYRDIGFRLVELVTCAGKVGCNEFVFRRER